MNILVLLKIALRNVFKNRMRSFLTMLGIIIGVASVIVMVSIGQGAQKKIEQQISSMGTNLLMVFPGSKRFQGAQQTINKLTLKDVDNIRQKCSDVSKVSATVRSTSQIIADTKNWNTTVNGVSVDFYDIRSWDLLKGSFFSSQDEHTNAKVVILGKTVADNLFPDGEAVGKSVRVGNIPFKVIGVLASKGTTAGHGGDQDDAAYAPVTTVLNRMVGGRKNINSIVVSAVSQDVISNAQEQIKSLLRQTHQIRDSKPDDFSIMNQTEIISMAAQTSQTFTMLLASIAAVSLIVGGIGIMNIMLVSVTERTREIGIRLSIGARSSDILIQFLVESMVLSMFGGSIGVISGIGIATLVLPIFNVSIAISPVIAAGSFLFSGFVGVFFGFYPARRAASLNPIEALRYE